MSARLPRNLLARFLVLAVCATASAQSRPALDAAPELPLAADQTADLLGARDALQTMRQPASTDRTAQLAAQQHIIALVTAASLAVDATTGQIDEEIAETHELQNFLAARRQREIDLLNLVSLGIGGTLGTASAALGLTPHTQASGVVGIISGTSITALSVLGLHLQPGGKAVLEARSNMLCHVFDLPSDQNNFYPQLIQDFMARPAPEDPLTRKQHLIAAWVRLGRIPPPTSEKGHLKVVRLASVPPQNARLSISDLDDRQAMLYDMRARIMYLKRDLALLMTAAAQVQP